VRTRQGLRLEDICVRTGLPLAQLEALESGTVDRMPDRVATVRALRAYANYLGLSGDQFALTLVDLWPSSAAAAQPPVVDLRSPTGVVPAPSAPTAAVPGIELVATVDPGMPTGQVGAVATALAGTWPTTGAHAAVPVANVTGFADTGLTPMVTATPHRPQRERRRPGAPLWLRIVVGVVALAVVVGVAGLIIQEVHPSWLRSIGITHGPSPTDANSGGGNSGNANSGGGSSGGTANPTARSTTTTKPSAFTVASTTATSATVHVAAATFDVEVTAQDNPSWVQVTAPGQDAPLFAGILEAGQSQTFPVNQSLVVQVGSAAAHLFVSSHGHNLGFYFPPAAPFTVTLTTSP